MELDEGSVGLAGGAGLRVGLVSPGVGASEDVGPRGLHPCVLPDEPLFPGPTRGWGPGTGMGSLLWGAESPQEAAWPWQDRTLGRKACVMPIRLLSSWQKLTEDPRVLLRLQTSVR